MHYLVDSQLINCVARSQDFDDVTIYSFDYFRNTMDHFEHLLNNFVSFIERDANAARALLPQANLADHFRTVVNDVVQSSVSLMLFT